MKFIKLLTLLTTALLSFMGHSSSLTTPMVLGERDTLAIDLMKLALEKSNYSYNLEQAKEWYNVSRLTEEIKRGHVSVMWAGAEQELQDELNAIKIPLFKGMLGYRVFVIEKNNSSAFHGVEQFYDLKALKAGLGRGWGDTKILQQAGLEVVEASKTESLFHMVEGGRFDYLPLAIHEAWETVETHPELALAVDQNVLLKYPMAMYLYVDKNNSALHQALVNGLEMAIADGSYDALFYGSKLISSTFKVAKLNQRNVVAIANPLLPSDVPVQRKELWLDTNWYSKDNRQSSGDLVQN